VSTSRGTEGPKNTSDVSKADTENTQRVMEEYKNTNTYDTYTAYVLEYSS